MQEWSGSNEGFGPASKARSEMCLPVLAPDTMVNVKEEDMIEGVNRSGFELSSGKRISY